MVTKKIDRRSFVKTTTVIGACLTGAAIFPIIEMAKDKATPEGIHIIGPKEGFSPQVGTLLSMMTWMREVVLSTVESMSKEQLDYLHDSSSNTIGAMLLHLAATERHYQIGTFNWGIAFRGDGKISWDAAMQLGDKGRKIIKGNNLDYYVNILNETRARTIEEFRKRDDSWLAKVDPSGFQNMPTNNYCKWFHVCEHESNHNGQIKWIKSRIPGARSVND